MDPLYFEDFQIDQQYVTGSRTITEADVVAFAGLSGDFNRLHMDEEFARQNIFGTRIAHGLLGLSIASGLMAQTGITNGTVIAFLGLTWTFKHAVKFGDTISVCMRVIDKRESSKPGRGIVRLAIAVTNQRGEVVQEGEHTLMVKSRAAVAAE